MALKKEICTVDLVSSDDDNDEVEIIAQGTKRKVVEVDLDDDLILGVFDGAIAVPDAKKLKKDENPATEEKENCQLVEYVVDDISPYHWTPDMREYYNEGSKNNLKYSVKRIHKSMSNIPKLWRVEGYPRFSTYGGKICFRCGTYGHQEKQCGLVKCYMCGNDGHKVKHCPNRKCLTCGKKTPSSYVKTCAKCLEVSSRRCHRCNFFGHSLIDCTDHWRRFHNVTALQRIEPPSGQVYKDYTNLWCCNCGRKGHVHEHCRTTGDSAAFAPTSTFVASYDRAFPGDRAESNEEPRCEYVLSTARDEVIVPKSQPRDRFPPIKKMNRYFEPENNARPKIVPTEPRKLNGKQRRERRRAKKAESLQNLQVVQHFQTPIKKKKPKFDRRSQKKDKNKPRFQQPIQNQLDMKVMKKKPRSDQSFQNRHKKKLKSTSTANAINQWNNFLMGIDNK